jgi:hypothetical protein
MVGQPPNTPARRTNPILRRMPATPYQVAGRRIDAKPFLSDGGSAEIGGYSGTGAARRSAGGPLQVINLRVDPDNEAPLD